MKKFELIVSLEKQMKSLHLYLKNNIQLIAILGFAFVIRMIFLLITRDLPVNHDPADYYSRALAIVNGKGYLESSFRPPMHPFFLSVIFYLFNKSVFVARFFQVLLGSLTLFPIYLIAVKIFNKTTGLLACLLFALYPTLIFFSHTLWSENIFLFIFLWAVYFLIKGRNNKHSRDLAIAGVLWGVSCLIREVAFYFILFVILWLVLTKTNSMKHAVNQALIFCLFSVFVIAPWTYRNYVVHKRFVPISTNGGWNFRIGNNRAGLFKPKDDCWSNSFTDGPCFLVMNNECQLNRNKFKNAMRFIYPNKLIFIEKSLWEACHLFTLDSFALRHLRNGNYKNVSVAVIRTITISVVLSYAAVMILGTLGIIASSGDARKWLFIMFAGYLLLLHSVTYSMSRYRIPLVPFIFIYASFALLQFKPVIKDVFHTRKRYAFLICLIFFMISWYMSAPLIYDMLKTGGQNFQYNYCFK